MSLSDRLPNGSESRLAEAADWFCRLHSDDANLEDLIGFQHWLEHDRDNASAYREVRATWVAFESRTIRASRSLLRHGARARSALVLDRIIHDVALHELL